MIIEKRRLLLVDDDEMARDFMTVRLSRRGFSVTTVEGGRQALDILKQQEFDLVLTDMMMPGLSGFETLVEIRKSFSMLELPVIMVTSVDQEESIISSLQAGANDYLVKPLNLEIALARINSQLSLKYLSNLKEEFLGFASHDLKKPLMLMLDIANSLKQAILQEKEADRKSCEEDLGLLIQTGENMSSVIQGFLEMELMSSGQLKLEKSKLSLNKIISDTIQNNEAYASKKKVTLGKSFDEKLPDIMADKLRLVVVIENLVGNAIKFSPEDTNTIIKTYSDDNKIYTEITDSGPGLSEADMEQLFVKHARLSNKPTGNETSTGLGLAICKQLIDLHDGEIGARKNPDRGTTFWFSLPVG